MRKLTQEEFDIRLSNKFGDKFKRLENYKGIDTKIKFYCLIHKTFETTPYRILYSKHGCIKCSNVKTGELHSKSDLKNSLYLLYPELLKEWDYNKNIINPKYIYPKSNFKVWWICDKCKNNYEQKICHRSDGHGCMKCCINERGILRSRPHDNNSFGKLLPEFNSWFNGLNGKLLLDLVTLKSNKKFNWKCNLGHEFIRSACNMSKSLSCPICTGIIQSIEDLKKWAKEKGGRCISKKYITQYDLYEWECDKGHRWKTAWTNIKHSNCWCPECNNSKGVIEVKNILDKLYIYYILEKRFEECKNINTLPFDFFIPYYNLLIEFDGKQHFLNKKWGFMSYDDIKNLKKRDQIKNKFAKDNRIKLIRIPHTMQDKIEEILTREYKKGFPRSINYSQKLLN